MDDDFIRRRSGEFELRDGTRVLIRPVVPEDKERIRAGLERLSPLSRYRRFMSPMTRFTAKQLAYLTEIDYADHFAFGALALDEPDNPGIGVARYVRLREDPVCADAAVAVVDDHQGKGLGALLLRALGAVALENGIRCFRADVLGDNRPAQQLLVHLGGRLEHDSPGAVRVVVDLPTTMDEMRGTPLYDVLRAVAAGDAPPVGMPRLPER